MDLGVNPDFVKEPQRIMGLLRQLNHCVNRPQILINFMPLHMFQFLPGIINLRLEFRLGLFIVVVDIILFHAHAAARQMVKNPPNGPSIILEPIPAIA